MSKRSKRRSIVSIQTKRFLRRVAERGGISYEEAVAKFYGRPLSSLDKNLAISLGVFHGKV